MTEVVEVATLGTHPVSPGSGSFDAVDLALRLSTDEIVGFGLRTGGYLERVTDPNALWGSYTPIRVDLDLKSVGYWDFNEVLWLGPADWPCLVWSNAAALRAPALDILFSPAMPGRTLRGHDDRGLPPISRVSNVAVESLTFRPLQFPAAFARSSRL